MRVRGRERERVELTNFLTSSYVPSNYVKKEKRSLLDKLMPKKTKRVNSRVNSNEISTNRDLGDIDNNINNLTIQSDHSHENLNTSNSTSELIKTKQKALVKYKYSAKK